MEIIRESELLEKLRERRKQYPSVAAMAKDTGGVSPQFMLKVLAGDYHPGRKIAAALGYAQEFAYRKDPNVVKPPDRRQAKLFPLEEDSGMLERIGGLPAPASPEW